MDYCQRVRQTLQTFSLEEKQCAFDALAIHATFLRGSPLRIEARIPVVSESNALKHHIPQQMAGEPYTVAQHQDL
jgi:hypothetical protein